MPIGLKTHEIIDVVEKIARNGFCRPGFSIMIHGFSVFSRLKFYTITIFNEHIIASFTAAFGLKQLSN